MSMLTPPGMGGKYRITGTAYPRMRRPRRRRRLVLAAVAAVAVLGLGGWGTLQLIDVFTGGGKKTEAAERNTAAACEPKTQVSAAPLPPRPGQITVNVYNATPRSGLAKATADELRKRGFAIGKVGNAPVAYDKKVPGAGLLLAGPTAHEGRFRVLATQLNGTQLKTDTRTTADIDLILGTAFKTLTAKPASDKALAALAAPPKPAARC
ncbi:LytR C-terminal domain-containing protein [Streptomyces sp. FIT100]|uniref:LytR C-terminal domain-containing protein n=1 Tax=Streptomyces sp. FIT100 TaxID=2837956 RepID=UPI0021C61577|nr:LytR C-terminal domain-containing protein [Streptomyces sp. FIT100]UUN27863.1 LytR C-terminal domain-containing protein [Streptomyces sp. FIT100]